ncbi:MAG TPA: Gfo/Idh/MocA family oxidoreductase [Candidatus Binataceae bacterium]|nr:Gfo/Idh/MocA family oxidoreductase [Candidatus Binataceae bacterium]
MKLRGAISGFGQVAEQGHLPGWRRRPEVEIVAIHEPIAERRQAALRAIKNVRVYEDLGLLLAGESPDFVDIASPPAYHAGAARAALEAGAHVLVEKPLCLDLKTLDDLYSLGSSHRRTLFCVHNWKHSPVYRRASEAISAGVLGGVSYCALTRLRTQQAGGAPWRVDPVIGGGGILIDHGWHVFYLMQWLMGGQAPLTIGARLEVFPPGVVDEVADLTATFSGGRLGHIHLSWRAPARRTSAILYGDEGMLEIEDSTIRLTRRSRGSEDLPVIEEPDNSYHPAWFAALAEEFEAAIAQGPQGRITRQNQREAQTALAILLAAKTSQASAGTPISLSGGRENIEQDPETGSSR